MARVLAIDQGTTATKAYTLDSEGRFCFCYAAEHQQHYPRAGWVEHDPEELVTHVLEAVAAAGDVAAVGLDHQGETVVAWDARDGKPICNAIVWQDQRTRREIEELKAQGAEQVTLRHAGLPLDPYFSASKLRWILDHVPAASRLLQENRLMMGTSDSFFIYRLSGVFATDASSASRTSLMNIETCTWDPRLCDLFGIPMECLPPIRPTTGFFGSLNRTGREIPLCAVVVDQQAALMGHGCVERGQVKATFGTGVFAQANVGDKRVSDDDSGILPTVAWQLEGKRPVYAVDAGVYNAGSAVNWMRRLRLFDDFAEINRFEREPAIARGIVFVPALSGLACPFWDRTAAGTWIGMDLDTERMDLCQAVLEGIALRTEQVVDALDALTGPRDSLSVDGGLTANDYFCQFLADLSGRRIMVPSSPDITTYGTGRFALLGSGLAEDVAELPPGDPPRRVFHPKRDLSALKPLFDDAVCRARHWRRASAP